jgi:hypothetical protein
MKIHVAAVEALRKKERQGVPGAEGLTFFVFSTRSDKIS